MLERLLRNPLSFQRLRERLTFSHLIPLVAVSAAAYRPLPLRFPHCTRTPQLQSQQWQQSRRQVLSLLRRLLRLKVRPQQMRQT